MDKGVHMCNILRRKRYAIIMHRVDVAKCVECRFHMSCRGFVVIQRQERIDRRKIRTSGAKEPTNTADQALIGFFALFQSQRVILLRGRGNGINRDT